MDKLRYYLVFILLLIAGFAVFDMIGNNNITSFDECVQAGYPILESYPEQCMLPDRTTFTNIIGFCGQSTYAYCNIDTDCTISGCSGQVCSAVGEDVITTCEYRECYNSEFYNLKCGCVSNTCMWN